MRTPAEEWSRIFETAGKAWVIMGIAAYLLALGLELYASGVRHARTEGFHDGYDVGQKTGAKGADRVASPRASKGTH